MVTLGPEAPAHVKSHSNVPVSEVVHVCDVGLTLLPSAQVVLLVIGLPLSTDEVW